MQLSDLDKSSDTDHSSSPTSDDDDDKKKKKRDKDATGFIGLYLAAGRRKGFCTMAGEANGARASLGGHATPTHVDSSPGSESDSEVNSTILRKQLESVESLGLSWLVLGRNLVRMSVLAAYLT